MGRSDENDPFRNIFRRLDPARAKDSFSPPPMPIPMFIFGGTVAYCPSSPSSSGARECKDGFTDALVDGDLGLPPPIVNKLFRAAPAVRDGLEFIVVEVGLRGSGAGWEDWYGEMFAPEVIAYEFNAAESAADWERVREGVGEALEGSVCVC